MSNKDKVDKMNEAIKSTPEYKVGKNINKISIKEINKEIADEYKSEGEKYHKEESDWALTTADEHNKEWLDDGIHMHNKDRAKKFLNSLRGHLIVSQALTYGIKHLRALEDRKNKYPKDGEHAEPSNRSDMEYLKKILFPLYDLFDAA